MSFQQTYSGQAAPDDKAIRWWFNQFHKTENVNEQNSRQAKNIRRGHQAH